MRTVHCMPYNVGFFLGEEHGCAPAEYVLAGLMIGVLCLLIFIALTTPV